MRRHSIDFVPMMGSCFILRLLRTTSSGEGGGGLGGTIELIFINMVNKIILFYVRLTLTHISPDSVHNVIHINT